jgi:hypothetical protein
VSFVLDPSLALSWYFEDERTPEADAYDLVRIIVNPVHRAATVFSQEHGSDHFGAAILAKILLSERPPRIISSS